MNPERLAEYCEEQLINNYHIEKERQKTNRFIALLIAITLISVSFLYMYYVVPSEEEIAMANDHSQVVAHSTVGGNNTNGM